MEVCIPVSSYTITIAPDDHTRATTTLRVEVTDTAARITELLVRAGEGDGLSAAQLPAVDLDQLLRAVTPATLTPAVTAGAADNTREPAAARPAEPAVDPAADDTVEGGRLHAVDEPLIEPFDPPQPVAAAVGTASPTRRTARKPALARGGREATKKKPAAKRATPASTGATRTRTGGKASRADKATVEPASRSARARKTSARKSEAAPPAATGGRSYRRAPDDLAEVYGQAGTAAAVADHYGVPRHTAQSWIRTLRRNGADAGQ
jgi:hypothetical protein